MKRFLSVMAIAIVSVVAPTADAQWDDVDPATSPAARFGHTMTTVGDETYLFGGQNAARDTYYSDLWRWDCENDTWERLAETTPVPARYYHGAASAKGKLFIGYGQGQTGVLGDLWRYDPYYETWTEMMLVNEDITDGVPAPHALGGMTGLVDGKIFVAGGQDGSSNLHNAYIIDPDPHMDTARVHWIESLSDERYGFVALSAPCGVPIIVGGWVGDYTTGGPSSDVLIWSREPEPWGRWHDFDFADGSLPVLPPVLAAGAQIVDRGKVLAWGEKSVIIGGEGSSDKTATTQSEDSVSVQYFDIYNRLWSYGVDAPAGMSSHGAAILPPGCGPPADTMQVLTFGGFSNGSVVDTTYHHDSPVEPAVGGTLYVTAAAHASGVGTTMWVTDLQAHNRGATAANCTVSLLEKNRANGDPETTTFSVPAGESVRLADVLLDRFAFEGSGALRVGYDDGDVVITSRTYNLLGEGNPEGLPAGATFGQFIPGMDESEALVFGDEARLVQLSNSPDRSRGFRTNIGLVNSSDAAAAVEVDLYVGDGTLLGTVTESLQAYEYSQITAIFERLTDDVVADGFAVVRTTTEGASFFTYASVVDNVTGDPTYVAPQQAIGAGGGFITASAHTAGVGGTQWRTDMVVHNATGQLAGGGVFLLPRDQVTPSPLMEEVAVGPGKSSAFADVLDSLFDFEGAAGLRFGNAMGPLAVTSRTYNLLGEGNELGYPAGATFGQFIPAVPITRVSTFGAEALLVQLTRSADASSGFRTNIGVLNVGTDTIEVEVHLFLADGTELGWVTRSLGAYESRQDTDIFRYVTDDDVADGFAVVRTTTEDGLFLAYASVVDNITGDPIYIPGM